jgi:hypothetical protein
MPLVAISQGTVSSRSSADNLEALFGERAATGIARSAAGSATAIAQELLVFLSASAAPPMRFARR